MEVKDYLSKWASAYKQELQENIMPFWLEHGWDRQHGGVYTCVDREGRLMDTTKSVWFQGRFGFIAAYAYNHVEKNPEWLAASKSCIDFIEQHCIDTDGHMYFEVTGDGQPLRKRRYVFSECFAAIAMSEYSIASDDKAYALKASEMFKRIQRFLTTPGFLEPKYLPTLQSRGHSITMILINTASSVRAAIADPVLDYRLTSRCQPFAAISCIPSSRQCSRWWGLKVNSLIPATAVLLIPVIASKPRGSLWRKPVIVVGIRNWYRWPFRYWNGLGTGAGTKSMVASSISVTAATSLYRIIHRI